MIQKLQAELRRGLYPHAMIPVVMQIIADAQRDAARKAVQK